MPSRLLIPTIHCALLALLLAAPAMAAEGKILITQAKAEAGGVTPDDTPGFPVSINRAGSYILASNLTVSANKVGIVINVANVTIDLNGYAVSGSRAPGAHSGIVGDKANITIGNGTITNFNHEGINGDHRWIIESMRVTGTDDGIRLGVDGSVRNSTVTDNGGLGIFCAFRCLVENSNISGNESYGIRIGSGTVLGNVIMDNGLVGISSIEINGAGYGNNTLSGNNAGGGGSQVFQAIELQPNHCKPFC